MKLQVLSMPIARSRSHKKLMKQARVQIDEGLENQRVRGHHSLFYSIH